MNTFIVIFAVALVAYVGYLMYQTNRTLEQFGGTLGGGIQVANKVTDLWDKITTIVSK